MIGGKEVAVEAKEASLLKLNQQFAEETDPDRQQALLEQIAAVEAGIRDLYEGTEESEGLYALMRRAVLLAVERADTDALYQAAISGQEEIERKFA